MIDGRFECSTNSQDYHYANKMVMLFLQFSTLKILITFLGFRHDILLSYQRQQQKNENVSENYVCIFTFQNTGINGIQNICKEKYIHLILLDKLKLIYATVIVSYTL